MLYSRLWLKNCSFYKFNRLKYRDMFLIGCLTSCFWKYLGAPCWDSHTDLNLLIIFPKKKPLLLKYLPKTRLFVLYNDQYTCKKIYWSLITSAFSIQCFMLYKKTRSLWISFALNKKRSNPQVELLHQTANSQFRPEKAAASIFYKKKLGLEPYLLLLHLTH